MPIRFQGTEATAGVHAAVVGADKNASWSGIKSGIQGGIEQMDGVLPQMGRAS
jgi:hypothetical protein